MPEMTISEYLDMWLPIFPLMVFFGAFLTTAGFLGFCFRPLYTRLIPIKRLQEDLVLGSAVSLYYFRGWFTTYGIAILLCFWASFFLIPFVSYIPITFFDIRINFIGTDFFSIPDFDLYGLYI
ncbi:MAG: hypothetical protein ACXAEU_13465, partial [Candidatus Hodarchaeales archaeon]